MANLIDLWLNDNALTGLIPPELGDLGNLESLNLGNNRLAGPIPPDLGNLASLRLLSLENNAGLAGALPLALASLSALEHFAWSGTGLCVPDDESFRAWLNAIESHAGTGVDCAVQSDQNTH